MFFNWDVYKSRRTALQHLRKNWTQIDTILESEDGLGFEFVHSQVISAFGEKLNDFINSNGTYVESYRTVRFKANKYESLELQNLASGRQLAAQRRTLLPLNTEKTEQQVVVSPTSGTQVTSCGGAVNEKVCWSRWPGSVKVVRLPRVSKYVLSILVDCAYTGYIRTDLTSGGIWQVLDCATYYEMHEVIRACCVFLTRNLARSNCVLFYHIGIRHKHNLQRCAWHKIRANFKFILEQNLAQQAQEDLPVAVGRMSESNNEEAEWRKNNLATIKYEHFEAMLSHDKLNVDREESLWDAIKLWCNYKPDERAPKIAPLLACMRFARFRLGTEFSARHLWRDPLVLASRQAQQQLAILDRNHRDSLSAPNSFSRDGFNLLCAPSPRQLRPRIPHSILLAIGGWQQGQPSTLIESYDLNCNLWFESKHSISSPLAYHGIECIGGLLYICGGTDGTEILNEVFTFDPQCGSSAQKPSMREPRCYVSTAQLDGYLYAMGGHNGQHRMKSVERFNIATGDCWRHVQDMNCARSDASACSRESYIYIAGGLNDQLIESSVEFYNEQDDCWTFIASMVSPRTSFTLLLYRDTLLAIGGNNGTERLASVEQYSFKTKLWSAHSSMRFRRSTFSAALLDESKLVVVGGYNGQTPFSQVETYDESQNQWVSLHKIRYDRSGLKVVVVEDIANALDYTFLGASNPNSTNTFQVMKTSSSSTL